MISIMEYQSSNFIMNGASASCSKKNAGLPGPIKLLALTDGEEQQQDDGADSKKSKDKGKGKDKKRGEKKKKNTRKPKSKVEDILQVLPVVDDSIAEFMFDAVSWLFICCLCVDINSHSYLEL